MTGPSRYDSELPDVLTQAAVVVMPWRDLLQFETRVSGELAGDPGNEELQHVVKFLREEIQRRPESREQRPVGYEAICGLCWETFNPAGHDDLIHGFKENGEPCGGVGTMMGAWY